MKIDNKDIIPPIGAGIVGAILGIMICGALIGAAAVLFLWSKEKEDTNASEGTTPENGTNSKTSETKKKAKEYLEELKAFGKSL